MGVACHPTPRLLLSSKMHTPPHFPILHSLLLLPPFLSPHSLFLLLSLCLLSLSLSHPHLFTLCLGLISVTLLSPQSHTKTPMAQCLEIFPAAESPLLLMLQHHHLGLQRIAIEYLT